MLSQKNEKVVIPKMTAVAPAAESNSSLIDSKNAPKLYAVPRVTADEKNAATTVSQARRESTVAPGDIARGYRCVSVAKRVGGRRGVVSRGRRGWSR